MSEWSDKAEECAKAKGLVVKWPADNELFVDIDDAESLAAFQRGLAVLSVGVLGFDRSPSPGEREGRFHARVRLDRPVKDKFERILLQALLGSDRLHEALSWNAAERGVDGVTVFFEKPEAP
jgi:hypothetical protein